MYSSYFAVSLWMQEAADGWEAYHVEGNDIFEGYLSRLVFFNEDLIYFDG